MNGWAGTRAEREWLATLRQLKEEVGRLADAATRIASHLETEGEEAKLGSKLEASPEDRTGEGL